MKRPQLFGKTLFADFLMSNLAMLLGLVMLSNVSHKKAKKEHEEPPGLRTEGKYAVVMRWPDGSQDDVDLYVRDPDGNIVYFGSRELGKMHLEHDDQGTGDKNAPGGGTSSQPPGRHEERVIIRDVVPGEYVVNVHMYHKRDPLPTPVTVRLVSLRGVDEDDARKERTLAANGAEATAFRFTVNPDGSVGGVNELERRLTGDAKRDPLRPPGGL
jgi:hypothetical protein